MEIQAIKEQLTIAAVLKHYNLKPDKHHRLSCPFHADKTPSMQVYYKTNTAFCFSANCKAHGKAMDVIDFVMLMEFGMLSVVEAKHEALKACAAMLGEVKQNNPNNPIATKTNLLQTVFTYFKNTASSSPAAKAYLESRSLNLKKIEVGFNTGGIYDSINENELLINDYLKRGLLIDKGNKAYQVFGKHCICFALRNNKHEITSLYFRSTLETDTAKHYYLKDRQGLYPSYPNKNTTKLILTESIIDAATLLQIPAVTELAEVIACYGTNGLNDEILSVIKNLQHLQEIIFAFDNDDAGQKATTKYAKQLHDQNKNTNISKIELPNKDVNETLIAHNQDIFIELINNRILLFSNENQLKKENIKTPETLVKSDNTEVTPISTALLSNAKALSNLPISTLHLDTKNVNKLTYITTTAKYYVLGGISKQLDNLKVMLSVENERGFKSRNKIDLYEDKQVEKLSKEVSEKLLLNENLLEQDLYTLTELLETYRDQNQASQHTEQDTPQTYTLSATEHKVATDFLKQDKVIKKLNTLLGHTGIVGEERNRIFLFLIALSYKMKEPLHALVQGSSGSGKTKIVRQISDCMPQEQVTRFTRISDKALYNYPKHFFKNRLLIIEDVDGLSEEAELAFRELQSSGELRSSVSIKQENGNITGGEKIVNGPIASMSCTTKGAVYEDNMSRVFLIAVDESGEQTKRIIAYQNKKAAGVIDSEAEEKAKQQIQNIIRTIEAKKVINPFAEKIQLPEEAHKIRRLNDLFQNFIKMVALINQYKRKITSNNQIIAELSDIETAIEIMFESIVLKVDELDGSLRQFYERLKQYIQKTYPKINYTQIQITQREIRQSLHLSKAQTNRYLQSLVELEYLSAYGHVNKGFKYKIQYWDNYEVLRKNIKEHLSEQIKRLKKVAETESREPLEPNKDKLSKKRAPLMSH
jgi:DNA primase